MAMSSIINIKIYTGTLNVFFKFIAYNIFVMMMKSEWDKDWLQNDMIKIYSKKRKLHFYFLLVQIKI